MHQSFARRLRDQAVVTGTIASLLAAQGAAAQVAPNDPNTTSPIKHVIVIIGENRTFDHVFATYEPRQGQTVLNLMSQGIVRATGEPGPNFGHVSTFGQPTQFSANQPGEFVLAPEKIEEYPILPVPGAAGAPNVASDTDGPPFATLELAANVEYGLFPGDLALITTGATGLSGTHVPDTRITNGSQLPNGPYQLSGPNLPYDSYTGSPVHRYYQMWQQSDCSVLHVTSANATGCLNDLFPFTETTISAGTDGAPLPQGYNPATFQTTEGAVSMAFWNMAQGDVPYFKSLADQFTISDNFHQSVWGGTGANHIMLGFADGLFWSNADGTPGTPPTGQIENPNSQAGTNNIWINDGYGSSATNEGGTYTNCSDPTQPGVEPVVGYLQALHVNPNCESGAFYLLNNYNPGYVGNGTTDPAVDGPFTIPPVTKHHIGDSLDTAQVSWAYFGEHWNDYLADPNPATNPAGYLYCNICNPFQYATQTMTNEQERLTHIHDTLDLYNDIDDGILPAVSFVKPSALNDGHPASSKLDLFESFTHKIIAQLQANPDLYASTAVFITFDEGGGYWDSGFIGQLDWFGDGTRIPLLVVSPFATGGNVNHSYSDHVSIDKFIERNWKLPAISTRSRDNLPNPTAGTSAYVPANMPALDDLFDLFNFPAQ